MGIIMRLAEDVSPQNDSLNLKCPDEIQGHLHSADESNGSRSWSRASDEGPSYLQLMALNGIMTPWV